MVSLEKVCALIAQHEGFRPQCYRDTRGFWTIGYGTNLDAAGAADRCEAAGLIWSALRGGQAITRSEGQMLLTQAAQHAMDVAVICVPGLLNMPESVQLVVVDMIYNLGREGFQKFQYMITALFAHDWKAVAAAMEDSLWYRQVGQRGKDDVALVLSALQTQE
jgi:lysozyme